MYSRNSLKLFFKLQNYTPQLDNDLFLMSCDEYSKRSFETDDFCYNIILKL